MADKYDPYRERLVVETQTVWPEGCEIPPGAQRGRLALLAHQHAAEAEQLEYVRVHTGFCRRITMTPGEIARLQGRPAAQAGG